MRQKLVAGNWKMHGTKASSQLLFEAIRDNVNLFKLARVVICPPAVYLAQAACLLKGSPIAWGAQNVSHETGGAFTGEISAAMLVDLGCEFVIVGHSERRRLYAEDDVRVAQKFIQARQSGLKPILCVGETLDQREAGTTETVIAQQLDAVLERAGIQELGSGVVAYEPVWAIGTGRTATAEQAQDVHAFIRQRLAAHDVTIAQQIQILYGGSVKASNADGLFAMPDIDGGLIGGASLDAHEFISICLAAG